MDIDTKRYDRQIRLWGLDTQRGLQGARVLLLRVTGLCNEIAKNLVLAGVGHLCIQDPGDVNASDVSTGGVFSLTEADIGRPRAEAAVEHLQALNPQVEISIQSEEFEALDTDFLRQFHFILGTHGVGAVRDICRCTVQLRGEVIRPDAPLAEGGERVAKRARSEAAVQLPQPKLLAAGTFGMFGFCALDLLEFEHTVPVPKKPATADGGKDVAAATTTRRVSYPTIEQAMSVGWQTLGSRVPRLYPALQLLCEQEQEGATKGPLPDVTRLEEARKAKLAAADRAEDFLREPVDSSFVAKVAAHSHTELAPVCAIVGGVVAAEVVKIISAKEAPMNNVFLFDATVSTDAAGVIARLG